MCFSGKAIKKTVGHIFHAATNPIGFTLNGGLRKFAKDAQTGGGVVSDTTGQQIGKYAPIVASFFGPLGAVIGAGIAAGNNYANTGNLGSSLLKGGLSYAGGRLGSSVGANGFGGNTIGSGLGDVSNSIISGAGNTFGSSVGAGVSDALGQGLGSTVGGFVGSEVGNSIADAATPYISKTPDLTNLHSYQPNQQSALNLPPSLQGFGGLNPDQQSTNIANQGTYGGGLGADAQSYFTNLINRRLVDQQGNVSDISNIKPIENSYLSKLGLGGYGNSNDLLQAISKWHAA